MKYLSKMLNNIKSWQWYDWSKNIQATIAFTVALVCVGYAATIGILEFFLAAITVFAILTAAGYLIIKDRKLAHCFVIFICACWVSCAIYADAVFRDVPNFSDICILCFATMSVINLLYLLFHKQTTLVKNTAGAIAAVVLGFWTLLIGAGTMMELFEPDIEYTIHKACIETKIAKGYPKEFAREYCAGPGYGCVEKFYENNCDADTKCCFATIAEDKKWNYLDYDERGNKIITNR